MEEHLVPQGPILVVDDDRNILFTMRHILEDAGYEVVTDDGSGALGLLSERDFSLIITDEKMPTVSGMELLSEVSRLGLETPVILITAFGSVDMAVKALKSGAYYFFEKPLAKNLDAFMAIVKQAIKSFRMGYELRQLRRELARNYQWKDIVAQSPIMRGIFEVVDRVAPTDKTVLITGESGTGKGLIARAVYSRSLRRGKPLVTVNCGALHESLLASELFGHTKGAFTGAVRDSQGRFELADKGTLFLDEIGELSFDLQKMLLRAIEDREFEKVGSGRTINVDVRVIASTNKDLKAQVEAGRFREDLYYRLSVVPIHVPPLRERPEDIAPLAFHFLKRYAEPGRELAMLPEVAEALRHYPWPGNVREMANVIQQMMVFCRGDVLGRGDLPAHIAGGGGGESHHPGAEMDLPALLEELESKHLREKLEFTGWNHSQAARLLGMSRKMLGDRIRKYGLSSAARTEHEEPQKKAAR